MNLTDRMNAVTPDELVGPAFAVIDTLQDYEPAAQMQSLAVNLRLLCEHYGEDVHEVIVHAGKRIGDDTYSTAKTLYGIRDYISGELGFGA